MKQEAIRQNHILNKNTTSDAMVMSKIRYFMDLNKEMIVALGQTEEHAERLQEGGNLQHEEFERYAELLQGENDTL